MRVLYAHSNEKSVLYSEEVWGLLIDREGHFNANTSACQWFIILILMRPPRLMFSHPLSCPLPSVFIYILSTAYKVQVFLKYPTLGVKVVLEYDNFGVKVFLKYPTLGIWNPKDRLPWKLRPSSHVGDIYLNSAASSYPLISLQSITLNFVTLSLFWWKGRSRCLTKK